MPSAQPSARESNSNAYVQSKQEELKPQPEDHHFNQSEIQLMEDEEEGMDHIIRGSPGNNEGELVGYSE